MKAKKKKHSLGEKVKAKITKIRASGTQELYQHVPTELVANLETALNEFQDAETRLKSAQTEHKAAKAALEKQDKSLRVVFKDARKVIKAEKKKAKKGKKKRKKETSSNS